MGGDAAGVNDKPPEKNQNDEQRAHKQPWPPIRFAALTHVVQSSAVYHQAAVVTRTSDKSVTAAGVFNDVSVQALRLRHRFDTEFAGENLLARGVLCRGLIGMPESGKIVH